MLRGLIFFTIAWVGPVAGVLAAEPRDNEATRDLKHLQGTWKEVNVFDKTADAPNGEMLLVEDSTMIFMTGDKEDIKFDVALDPVPHTKQIDLVAYSNDKEKQEQAAARLLKKLGKPAPDIAPRPRMLGIYGLGGGGDELVLCLRSPGKERPTEFSMKRDDGAVVRMFKRVKNGAAGDLKRLQGTWRPTAAFAGVEPKEPRFTVVVKDDVMTMREGEKDTAAFDISLYSSSNPKKIDLVPHLADDEKKKMTEAIKKLSKSDDSSTPIDLVKTLNLPTLLGIYYVGKLKNDDEASPDKLILMYQLPKKDRPTGFSAKQGDDAIMLLFVRAKE